MIKGNETEVAGAQTKVVHEWHVMLKHWFVAVDECISRRK